MPPSNAPSRNANVPILVGANSWSLPASVRDAVRAVPERRAYRDLSCQADGCGSPLFVKLPVVRLARGYRDGEQRGYLFACVACGTVRNPSELIEMGRDSSTAEIDLH